MFFFIFHVFSLILFLFICRYVKQFEKKHTLAEFFNLHWDNYLNEEHKPLRYEQYKAVNAIRNCRTAVLGVEQYVCVECGEMKEIYHNCKNRFCPTCSWRDTIEWAEKMKSKLLNVPHRHVVFTLPHALLPLINSNGKHLLNILFRTAAETLKDWAEHKHKLKIGVISVLHTFGENKKKHVHVHMIVSWGGISQETGELVEINGDFVKFDFFAKKFRCKFEDELVKMFDNKSLKHKFPNRIAFLAFLKRINKKNWIVHFEPPMQSSAAVIRYIGRYSKRACISEYKITEINGDFISFTYKDYKTIGKDRKPVERIEKLHYREFFPRLLQHVPLPYFRLVRYYGLYATKSSIKEEYLDNNNENIDNQDEWQGENPFICTVCNKERVYLYTTFDTRTWQEREKQLFDKRIHSHYIMNRTA